MSGKAGAKQRPRTAVAPANRGFFGGPRALGSLLPQLTRAAFEKHGFAAAALITDWAHIVGREVAQSTQPERLKWPRPPLVRGESPDAPGRGSATLVLRVDPARAMDVQYASRQIIERINAYFGYAAVADIRIHQGDIAPARPAPSPRRALPRSVARADDIGGIADTPLRDALARLAVGVRAGRLTTV